MAVAINTHQYEEAIDKERSFIKIGEVSLFWGLVKYPTGYYHEKFTYSGLCKKCGQIEINEIHGHFKLDKAPKG